MSFFIDHCCFKLNYLICGSNESSSEKKTKKKFKSRQQSIVKNINSSNKIINQTEPISLNSYSQHYVNVTPSHHPIQQQNSIQQYSPESSLISFIDQQVSSNGVIIKNIILRRNNPNERLGLTLCYGITSNSATNIYIQQIDKESIAGHQGELRSGDQIIKINNHHVTSRDEAITLINGACHILLQIIRFEFSKLNFPTIKSIPLTEDDSGVILGCHTDFEIIPKSSIKNSLSLSLTALNHCLNCHDIQLYSHQFQSRRCLSLNDLRLCSINEEKIDQKKQFIRSQSLFGTTTDNEQLILKPLPFHNHYFKEQQRDDSDSGLVCIRSHSNDSHHHHSHSNPNQWTLKHFRRRCREQRLKEQYQTTDDEPISELKQGKYWTRQQRKEHLTKSKQYRQRAKYFQQYSIVPTYSDSATEDFNLLNRIFLRENQYELKQKPFLAYKYGQQSSIERKKLKQMIQQHYYQRIKTQSTTTISISSTIDKPSMIIL